MRADLRVGVLKLQALHLLRDDALVRGAVAAVQDHVLLGQLLRHVAAEVHVRDKQHVALGQLRDHLHGVRGRHAHVRPRLYLCGRVDVARHGHVAGVPCADLLHVLAAHHVRHGAQGARLRVQHAARRVQELHALRHERHPGEHDGVAVERLGEACQVERVAHVVRERLGLSRHVVVRQHHGPALALQLLYAARDARELLRGEVRPPTAPEAARRLAEALLLHRRPYVVFHSTALPRARPSGAHWVRSMPPDKTADKSCDLSAEISSCRTDGT